MKKILSLLLVLVFVVTIFSACKNDEWNIESFNWQLESVVSLNENGKVIAVNEKSEDNPDAKIVEITLAATDGELILNDKTNAKIYKGAYEEMIVTDNTDDYKIILNGKEGLVNATKTVYVDGIEKPTLIMTISDYDLYFYQVNVE